MDVLRYAGAPDKEKKRVQYYFDYITQYNHPTQVRYRLGWQYSHPTQVQCGFLPIQDAAACSNPWRCPHSTHTCHAFPSQQGLQFLYSIVVSFFTSYFFPLQEGLQFLYDLPRALYEEIAGQLFKQASGAVLTWRRRGGVAVHFISGKCMSGFVHLTSGKCPDPST